MGCFYEWKQSRIYVIYTLWWCIVGRWYTTLESDIHPVVMHCGIVISYSRKWYTSCSGALWDYYYYCLWMSRKLTNHNQEAFLQLTNQVKANVSCIFKCIDTVFLRFLSVILSVTWEKRVIPLFGRIISHISCLVGVNLISSLVRFAHSWRYKINTNSAWYMWYYTPYSGITP